MNAYDGSARIWLLPDAFWKATKEMPPEKVDQLMLQVERLAEKRDLSALRSFPFIYIGESSHRREEELSPALTAR